MEYLGEEYHGPKHAICQQDEHHHDDADAQSDVTSFSSAISTNAECEQVEHGHDAASKITVDVTSLADNATNAFIDVYESGPTIPEC
eukprot:12235593-Karenia_brevis.AAC.1